MERRKKEKIKKNFQTCALVQTKTNFDRNGNLNFLYVERKEIINYPYVVFGYKYFILNFGF